MKTITLITLLVMSTSTWADLIFEDGFEGGSPITIDIKNSANITLHGCELNGFDVSDYYHNHNNPNKYYFTCNVGLPHNINSNGAGSESTLYINDKVARCNVEEFVLYSITNFSLEIDCKDKP